MKDYSIVVFLTLITLGCSFQRKQNHDFNINAIDQVEVIKIKPNNIHPLKADLRIISSINKTFRIEVSNGKKTWEFNNLGKVSPEILNLGDWYDETMTLKYIGNPELKGEIRMTVTFFY
tara:strand:+ start:202 stop:558 length:357 start_codon:yes stop_codon:yes gene_type:complete